MGAKSPLMLRVLLRDFYLAETISAGLAAHSREACPANDADPNVAGSFERLGEFGKCQRSHEFDLIETQRWQGIPQLFLGLCGELSFRQRQALEIGQAFKVGYHSLRDFGFFEV